MLRRHAADLADTSGNSACCWSCSEAATQRLRFMSHNVDAHLSVCTRVSDACVSVQPFAFYVMHRQTTGKWRRTKDNSEAGADAEAEAKAEERKRTEEDNDADKEASR